MEFDTRLLVGPLIRLSINGCKPMLFLVDTGSAIPLVILPEFAKTLHIEPTEQKLEVLPKSNPVLLAKQSNVRLIGLPNQPPALLTASITTLVDVPYLHDFGNDKPVAGIVGLPMLTQKAVCFDFAARTLTFYTKPHIFVDNAAKVCLPLTHGIGNEARLLHIPLQFGETTLSCAVDTGSWQTHIPTSLSRQMAFLAAERSNVADVSGGYPAVSLLLPSVKMGGLNEENVVVDAADTMFSAIVGTRLLSRFRVTLDFLNHQMVLERAANYKELLQPSGDTTFYCKKQQGHWQVAELQRSGDAQAAGLQVGDILVGVDGKSVDELSYAEVQALIAGRIGTQATLSLTRNNTELEISYLRFAQFATSQSVGIGVKWENYKDGRTIISSIALNSPAIKAGLRVNDEVLKVNDLDVSTSSIKQLVKEVKQPEGTEITFVVQRKGENNLRIIRLRVEKLVH